MAPAEKGAEAHGSDAHADPSCRQDGSLASKLAGRDLAFRSGRAITVFLAMALSGLLVDLLSKHYVFQSFLQAPALKDRVEWLYGPAVSQVPPDMLLRDPALRPYLQRQVLPGVRFTISTNPGVVFGLGLSSVLVAMASIAAFVLVLALFATSDRRAWSAHVGLGMILAGAAGNFYDRQFAAIEVPGDGVICHQVRDFIDCSQLYYKWIFNVADVLLVVGVALLLLYWWRHQPPKKPTASQAG